MPGAAFPGSPLRRTLGSLRRSPGSIGQGCLIIRDPDAVRLFHPAQALFQECHLLRQAHVPAVLLGLAAAKATLVVQFYMHLRYDKRIMTWAFLIPVIVGTAAALILQLLVNSYR